MLNEPVNNNSHNNTYDTGNRYFNGQSEGDTQNSKIQHNGTGKSKGLSIVQPGYRKQASDEASDHDSRQDKQETGPIILTHLHPPTPLSHMKLSYHKATLMYTDFREN